jgi:hypothetical protein
MHLNERAARICISSTESSFRPLLRVTTRKIPNLQEQDSTGGRKEVEK